MMQLPEMCNKYSVGFEVYKTEHVMNMHTFESETRVLYNLRVADTSLNKILEDLTIAQMVKEEREIRNNNEAAKMAFEQYLMLINLAR